MNLYFYFRFSYMTVVNVRKEILLGAFKGGWEATTLNVFIYGNYDGEKDILNCIPRAVFQLILRTANVDRNAKGQQFKFSGSWVRYTYMEQEKYKRKENVSF